MKKKIFLFRPKISSDDSQAKNFLLAHTPRKLFAPESIILFFSPPEGQRFFQQAGLCPACFLISFSDFVSGICELSLAK
jgi:hypothetical protein